MTATFALDLDNARRALTGDFEGPEIPQAFDQDPERTGFQWSVDDYANFRRAEAIDEAAGITSYTVKPTAAGPIVLDWASDMTPERIEWLWTDRLPLHDLAVIAGEPGLGKSTTTAELAAQITRGTLNGTLTGQPRTVLIASAEDHFESVVWGRLRAAGADMEKVANIRMADDGMLAIPGDVDEMANTCRQLRAEGRPAGLIVVDPISAYLGGVDSHKDAAVRGALAPLAKLAHAERVCVLVVAHLNKSSAGNLLNRISGSGAFGAAPRSVLAFARDPDDDAGEQGLRRVIVHAKSNHGRYAPTLAAHIEAPMIAEVNSTVSRLVIDGEVDISPDDLRPDGPRDQSSAEDVGECISEALSAGPRKSREVKAEVAQSCGVHIRTVERAARRMVERGELVASRAGVPPIATWCLGPAVAIGGVANGNLQGARAIAGVRRSDCDTTRDVTQSDGSDLLEPGAAQT